MSKRDKLFRLEMYMEHVVHRLEGDHADYTLFLSQMMHSGTLEMLVDVFTQERRKFFRVRRFVEVAVFMLGQIARRINSYLLPRIIDLHLDLSRLWQSEGIKCQSEEEARRIVREFEYCHDALLAEISFMDVRERANIWPKAPVPPVDTSGSYEVFHPEKGMTEEEATRESRAAELRNHRREMRRIGFAKKVAALTSCFSHLADEVQGGVASAPSEHSPDWHMLSETLKTRTWIVYYEFYDMDLYFCDDPKRTNYYEDIGMDFAGEETKETPAKQKMDGEIVRYVNAAIALARSVKSESASGFVLAKSLFEKHKGSFSDANSHISVKADLATFIDTLKSSIEHLHTDVAAAELGGEQPLKVELTKKSGETIAKAVRPGRGGARRIFSEEVQEKCWHYWEIGRKNPAVAQIAAADGRKLRHEDVFNYFRRELTALEPPIDTPAAFKSALRARTNRISRKKSH
ncbi:MAG: hypothetical protein K6G91_13250 [Kiritimatiellae bacterium]|nr:hypothetical protein [Kiritimatiellia bacterium]